MKIQEIVLEQQLDEVNWKKPLAAIGTAAALAGGVASTYNNQQTPTAPQTQQVDSVAKAEPEVKQQNPLDLVSPASAKQIQQMMMTPNGKLIYNYAVKSGMQGAELAQFMGQTAHETQNFTKLRERGGALDFKKYEPVYKKDKSGKVIIDPETKKPKDFNSLSKTLGNTQLGDGARYIGRGFLQLTGRWNYAAASKALGIDLVKHPELVEKPEVAARVALWFWQNRVQKRMSHDDYSNTPDVTRSINRGDKIDQRHSKYLGFTQNLADKK